MAVVVEVPERAPAAAMRGCDAGTGLLLKLLERPIAQIAEHHSRCLAGIPRQLAFHVRVDVAGHHEEIRVAIVVEVHHPGAPPDIPGLDSNSRRPGEFVRISGCYVVM